MMWNNDSEKCFPSYYSSAYDPYSGYFYADEWGKQDSLIEDMEGDFVIDYSAPEYQITENSLDDSLTEPS